MNYQNNNQQQKTYSPLTQYIYWLKGHGNMPFPEDANSLYLGTLLNLCEDDWRSCVYMNSLINEDLITFYTTKVKDFGMLHKHVNHNPTPQFIKTTRPDIKTLKAIRSKYPHLKLSDIELFLQTTEDSDGFLESIGLKDTKITKNEKTFSLLHSILEQDLMSIKKDKKYYTTNVDDISNVNVIFLGTYPIETVFPKDINYVETNVCLWNEEVPTTNSIEKCFDSFSTILSFINKKAIIVPYTDVAIKRCGIEDQTNIACKTVYKLDSFTVIPISSLNDSDRLSLVTDVVSGSFSPKVKKTNKKTTAEVKQIICSKEKEETIDLDLSNINLPEKIDSAIDMFFSDEPKVVAKIEEPKKIVTEIKKPLQNQHVEEKPLQQESGLMLVDTIYKPNKETGDKAYQIFRKDKQKIIKEIDVMVDVYTGDNSKSIMPIANLTKHKIPYYVRWNFMKQHSNSFVADLSFAVHKNVEWRRNNVETDYPLRIVYLDIECYTGPNVLDFSKLDTEAKQYPINLISIYDSYVNKFYTFVYNLNKSEIDYDKITANLQHREKIVFDLFQYDDEKEMLTSFLNTLNSIECDLLTGYNTDSFDLPYIYYRCKSLNIILDWNMREYSKQGQDYIDMELPFIHSIDYYRLYMEMSFNKRESYKLGFITQLELGITKLDFEGSMTEAFDKTIEQFIAYNINDVFLVKMLNDKLDYIGLMHGIVKATNIGWKEGYTTLRIIDGLIYTYLTEQNKVFISRSEEHDKEGLQGAYVRTPNKGLYEWVCDLDLASLYPYIIARYNLFPDTFVAKIDENIMNEFIYNKEKFRSYSDVMLSLHDGRVLKTTPEKFESWVVKNKYIVTIAGTIFKSHEEELSPLFDIVNLMIESRTKFKNLMFEAIGKNNQMDRDKYHNMQLTYKVITNSLYGAMANAGFRFFSNEVAQTITKTGREISKMGSCMADQYLKKMELEKKIDVDFIDLDVNFLQKAENKLDRIIYGDSVTGDSTVYINGEKIRLEDFWGEETKIHTYEDGLLHYKAKEKLFFVEPKYTLTVDEEGNQIECDIDYVMRHRNEKQLFRIKTKSGKYVTVTEDHSLIVLDKNNKLVQCKPRDLQTGTQIISIEKRNPSRREVSTVDHEDVVYYMSWLDEKDQSENVWEQIL